MCGRDTILGVDRCDAAQAESEAGNAVEQPLEVRLVGDSPGYVRHSIVRGDRHSLERRGIPRTKLSFDDEAVVLSGHSAAASLMVSAVCTARPEDHPGD
jgi:hypothetical protein